MDTCKKYVLEAIAKLVSTKNVFDHNGQEIFKKLYPECMGSMQASKVTQGENTPKLVADKLQQR